MTNEVTSASNQRITYLLLVLLLVSIPLVYHESVSSMVSIWYRSETFAHGFLIFPISGVLIWLRRKSLLAATPSTGIINLLPLVAVVAFWLLAYLADVQVGQHIAVVAMFPATAMAVLGYQPTSRILFPLLFLFFAVPVGEFLIPPLMELTATFTIAALRLSGIPVFREGLFFSIPSGYFEVAVACSGIRYLIASFALGTLFAYLNYQSKLRRVAFVVLSIVVPLVANGIRAYGIVMIAHLSEMKYATGVDHLVYGWLFFGVVIMLLFWAGSFFRDTPASHGDTTTRREPASHNVQILPQVFMALAVALAVVAGPLVVHQLEAGVDRRGLVAIKLPSRLGQWQNAGIVTSWQPKYLGADLELSQTYVNGAWVKFTSVHYFTQEQNAELVNSENELYDSEQWRSISNDSFDVRVGRRKLPVHEFVLTNDRQTLVVWSWYLVEGLETRSAITAKIMEVWGLLIKSTKGSAVIAVATPLDELDDSKAILIEFLNDNYDVLRAKVSGECVAGQVQCKEEQS